MDDIERILQLAGIINEQKQNYISDLLDDLSHEQLFYLVQYLNRKYDLRQDIVDWRMQQHLAILDPIPADAQIAKGAEMLSRVASGLRDDEAKARRAQFRTVD